MTAVVLHAETLRAGRHAWRVELRRAPDGALSWRASRLDERMSVYVQQPADKAPKAVADLGAALAARYARRHQQPRAVQMRLGFDGVPA